MKKLTVKQNMTIANVLMGAGVLYDLYDMVVNGYTPRPVPLIICVSLVAAGAIWRYTQVKCPHCGDNLRGIHSNSKLPDRCPVCGGTLK